MIEKFFKKVTDKKIELDFDQIQTSTSAEFVQHMKSAIADPAVRVMNFAEKGKSRFIYFSNGTFPCYSFSFDKKVKQIIFSKEIEQNSWSFVVGYQLV